MTPERYAAYRRSLGRRSEAARILDCATATIRHRERGHLDVSDDAAERIRAAVHELAMGEDASRAHARRRRLSRRHRGAMTPLELRRCIRAMGWETHYEAARVLLGDKNDHQQVSRWVTGRTPIPGWVARDLRTLLGLEPDEPWPSGVRRHHYVPPDLT